MNLVLKKSKLACVSSLLIFLFIFLLHYVDSYVSFYIKANLVFFMPSKELNSAQSISNEPVVNSINAQHQDDFKHADLIVKFHKWLELNEKKFTSQNKEDGVLIKLAGYINRTRHGVFVEFGTENAHQTNTRHLRENYAWTGLYMDNKNENVNINLHKESVTHSNVLELFEKYNVIFKLYKYNSAQSCVKKSL